MKQKILFKFRHGLGDAVQFTCILQHLQKYRPDQQIDVAALVGKHSAFHGLCNRSYILDSEPVDESQYDEVNDLGWWESPFETKPRKYIREFLGREPDDSLMRYKINIGQYARPAAFNYLNEISGGRPVVIIHYEGNTSADQKNLPHEFAAAICEQAIVAGAVPVILDWDFRSPLPDQKTIFCPDVNHHLWKNTGTGDAEVLAALISGASLMIGVDSGPLHVAGATDTPTIAIWTGHHPSRFYDLCPNVTHLVPHGPYRISEYDDLQESTGYHIAQMLQAGKPQPFSVLRDLTATAYDESYYEEHKRAGLDYLNFGDWQRQYGRWFAESLGLKEKKVLDVGCACGSILRGLGQAGVIVQGVDVNERMIQLGRRRWPDMAPLLSICDAVNLHLFGDATWDGIHSAQSAEHWKPELVPSILRELARVTKPGGLFFCCLDTEELFARQGRKMENEDPTHICIRPLRWWHGQLVETGWEVCSDEFILRLQNHPQTFLTRYDWDWFVARRK